MKLTLERKSALGAALAALGVLLAADLLTIAITGDTSLVGGRVGPRGFLFRLTVLAGWLVAGYLTHRFRNPHRLALFLMLLPTLYQFQFTQERRVGDGFFYYAYLQSFWKDGDLHFENEYRQYGIESRPELTVPTRTGYRRNNFTPGPAVLWSPFFGLGEICGRVLQATGAETDLSGYGPVHRNAVALGSLLYGFAAVLLVQSLLSRYFAPLTAFFGAALMWLATSLHWYMVQQPLMSHGVSTFAAALFLWMWEKSRVRRGAANAFLLGLAAGIAICVRWQNALLLILPGLDLLSGLSRRRDRPLLASGAALSAGVLAGVLPQLAAWQVIFGVPVLPYPPQGPEYLRLARPFVLETLFSSRHGLLSWTPIIWLGYLGLIPLLRRPSGVRPKTGWPPVLMMTLCLLLMTYVNMCVGDWWGGGSFGARRFDAALPILAFGMAASFDVLRRVLALYPTWVAGALLACFPLWNFLFMEQYRRYWIHPDDTVSFSQVTANSARILFQKVGSPFSWPANWLFAWRYGTSPEQYDRVVGRYLFYRNNNLGGVLELGEDDGGLIGEGWRRPERREGAWVRQTRKSLARLYVPLETPRDLLATFRASSRPGPLEVAVDINGAQVGRFLVSPGFQGYRVRIGAHRWRRGINILDLQLKLTDNGQLLLLDRVVFQPLRKSSP
ncbi:MAG: hypothetical protein ACE5JI_04210 [Acidobacteriota bacterium]